MSRTHAKVLPSLLASDEIRSIIAEMQSKQIPNEKFNDFQKDQSDASNSGNDSESD